MRRVSEALMGSAHVGEAADISLGEVCGLVVVG